MSRATSTKKRSWKVVTPENFKAIKESLAMCRQLNPDMTTNKMIKMIEKISGRSWATIKLIHDCNSFEEYQAARKAQSEKYRHPMDSVLEAARTAPELPLDETTEGTTVEDILGNDDEDETTLDVLKDIRNELRTLNKRNNIEAPANKTSRRFLANRR